MSRATSSTFVSPNYDVDNRTFFSDVSISGVETLNKYIELIQAGDYTSASTLLNEGTYDGAIYNEIDFFGAWILNLLENRLYAIENYLLSGQREKPDLLTISDTEPSDKSEGYCWISSIASLDE